MAALPPPQYRAPSGCAEGRGRAARGGRGVSRSDVSPPGPASAWPSNPGS